MASISIRSSLAFLAIACIVSAKEAAQVTTGQLGDALRITNNPAGAAYVAKLTENRLGVVGTVTTVNAGEGGTEFAVNIDNLPAEGGPFKYHIHVDPVPSDGNCTGTLAHLDSYIRGEMPACDAERPETCQVGDLSGKHGTVNGTSFRASFTDPYVSMSEGVGAFFGNRSITVHFANATRIACGNFSSLSNAAPAPGAGAGVGGGQGGLDGTATLVPAAAGPTGFGSPFMNGSAPTNIFISNTTVVPTAPVLSASSTALVSSPVSDGIPTAAPTAQEASTNDGARRRAMAGLTLLVTGVVAILSCI